VTGPGGSGKSIMSGITTMLAGADNATSATIETLESSRERASVIGYSLIILPVQEKWSGDGAGLKAITGGDSGGEQQPDALYRPQRGRVAPPGDPALPGNHPGERARPAAEGKDTGRAGRYRSPADAALQEPTGRPQAASVAAELRRGDAHQA